MSDILKAIILGVVEGLTEFLPVSSTGHLIIVNRWISFGEGFTEMFDVVIQLGAILAVVVYFWKTLVPFGKEREERREVFGLWVRVFVALVPALFFGALFGDWIEERLFGPFTVALALIAGGIALILIERKKMGEKIVSMKDMSYSVSFGIGLAQCLAMVPGTSRSAATILGAMFLGATRSVAARFSFFLAIPTMAAASAYALMKHGTMMSAWDVAVLATGFITSFLVAWAAIAFLIHYIQKNDLKPFGYYRIVLGLAVLAFFFF